MLIFACSTRLIKPLTLSRWEKKWEETGKNDSETSEQWIFPSVVSGPEILCSWPGTETWNQPAGDHNHLYSTRTAALLMFWRGCTQRCRKHGTIRLLSSFYKPRAFKAVWGLLCFVLVADLAFSLCQNQEEWKKSLWFVFAFLRYLHRTALYSVKSNFLSTISGIKVKGHWSYTDCKTSVKVRKIKPVHLLAGV